MTKKHFISLADWIKRHNNECSASPQDESFDRDSKIPFTLDHLRTLAAFCESNNVNFNRGRWLDYIAGKCGKSGGKPKETRQEASARVGRNMFEGTP